ncbi:putative transcriptional regulator [Rhodoligotrophos appendicifer]|uniref:MucR family transcriptional regulator n=1 Tax=Rhodoligotrophos appendicifer TaxID=987056 RepID=UPI001186E1DB|nr:MucR family transcriptional regulator [Rhodoligotrophos appendicifer]
MSEMTQSGFFVELTANIVSAYVEKNSVPAGDLASLIASVHGALNALGQEKPAESSVPLTPAVSIRKSVTPEYIICLEDGKKFKSLKRHLNAHYGMSPEQYRAKWGLPSDYPMVAPSYSEARSNLARSLGLGRKPAAKTAADSAKIASKPAAAPAKKPARVKAASAEAGDPVKRAPRKAKIAETV